MGIRLSRGISDPRFLPPYHGFKTWTAGPWETNGSTVVATAGTLYTVRVPVDVAMLVSTIHMYVATAGSALTAGQCFAALFGSAGAHLATTDDQAAAWATTGPKAMALSAAQQVPAGEVEVGFWFNGTTGPAMVRGTSTASGFTNIGLSGTTLRSATANTGLTTAAPGALGAKTAFAQGWWVALS